MIDPRRDPDGTNTTLLKTFRGGVLALVGANSASSLAFRAVRVLILDEIDRYPLELAKEGSTLAIVKRRTQTYGRRRRIFQCSSPTLTTGAIAAAHARGDQRIFVVPCPACGDEHALRWEDVHYPDDNPDGAHFRCQACQHPWTESERLRAVTAGHWVPTATPIDPTVRSYHMWAGYSPLVRLSQLVRESIDALQAVEQGDLSLWRTFQQTVLGRPVNPDDEVDSPVTTKLRAALRDRRGADWSVPSDTRIVAAADLHADRLEVLVTAWSSEEEVWLLDHHVLAGKPDGGSCVGRAGRDPDAVVRRPGGSSVSTSTAGLCRVRCTSTPEHGSRAGSSRSRAMRTSPS